MNSLVRGTGINVRIYPRTCVSATGPITRKALRVLRLLSGICGAETTRLERKMEEREGRSESEAFRDGAVRRNWKSD